MEGNNLIDFLQQQMTATYAPIQISDALLKMQLYISMLNSKLAPEKHEKVVILATETFLKFMQNQDFSKEAYDKVKALTLQKNYYGLLLLDQMIKNSKYAFKTAKREVEHLFKIVWDKVATENENAVKLENLKLLVKVWGYIYGQKYEENIRRWLEQAHKIKLTISPENQAELKELYGTHEQPKPDFKMQELIINMDIQQKPKRGSNHHSNHDNVFQALGLDLS